MMCCVVSTSWYFNDDTIKKKILHRISMPSAVKQIYGQFLLLHTGTHFATETPQHHRAIERQTDTLAHVFTYIEISMFARIFFSSSSLPSVYAISHFEQITTHGKSSKCMFKLYSFSYSFKRFQWLF